MKNLLAVVCALPTRFAGVHLCQRYVLDGGTMEGGLVVNHSHHCMQSFCIDTHCGDLHINKNAYTCNDIHICGTMRM